MKNKFIIIIALLSCLITSIDKTEVRAAVLTQERTEYNYVAISNITGLTRSENIYKKNMEGEYAFCVELGVETSTGIDYNEEVYVNNNKDLLSKIAYYGYTLTSKTDYDYAVTQMIIWEKLGNKLITTNIPNYQARKKEILNNVANHNKLPSFNNTTNELLIDGEITLTDTNNVINSMHLKSNTTNTSFTIKDNKLIIKANDNSVDGSITFQKVSNGNKGASIVYKKTGYQTLVKFSLEDAAVATVNIDIKEYGDIEVLKIDEETNDALINTKIKFEYDGVSKEVITDNYGVAKLPKIKEGTHVKITEVEATNGYYNDNVSEEVIVVKNETIKVILENKLQMGQFNILKKGNNIDGFISEESDYGNIHTFTNSYIPLKDVIYKIVTVDDIIVRGKVYYEAGEIVTTLATNAEGNFSNPPNLYLGKYQAIEIDAPDGYVIDPTPIDFEFTYEDQYIEIQNIEKEVKNERQEVVLRLFKNDEVIVGWEKNQPIIDEIKANNKVFGLYTNQDYIFDGIVLNTDSLIDFGNVENGELKIKNTLPDGKYYFKELDSGKNHMLDEEKYEFTYEASGNKAKGKIDIYNNDKLPITNKLHLNEFSILKINEEARFDDGEYIFEMVGNGKGAKFSLEDLEGNVLQIIDVEDDSKAHFKNIPVGEFFIREVKTSSSEYLLSDEVIKIVSTKEGIVAYNTSNEEILSFDETVLFEVNNYLIKGSVEILKVDGVSNEKLSDVEFELFDNNMNYITKLVTNENGLIIFDNIPKGKYYVKEAKSRDGYVLDDTLHEIEITKDGEEVKKKIKNYKLKDLPKTGLSNISFIVTISLLLSLIILKYKKKK